MNLSRSEIERRRQIVQRHLEEENNRPGPITTMVGVCAVGAWFWVGLYWLFEWLIKWGME